MLGSSVITRFKNIILFIFVKIPDKLIFGLIIGSLTFCASITYKAFRNLFIKKTSPEPPPPPPLPTLRSYSRKDLGSTTDANTSTQPKMDAPRMVPAQSLQDPKSLQLQTELAKKLESRGGEAPPIDPITVAKEINVIKEPEDPLKTACLHLSELLAHVQLPQTSANKDSKDKPLKPAAAAHRNTSCSIAPQLLTTATLTTAKDMLKKASPPPKEPDSQQDIKSLKEALQKVFSTPVTTSASEAAKRIEIRKAKEFITTYVNDSQTFRKIIFIMTQCLDSINTEAARLNYKDISIEIFSTLPDEFLKHIETYISLANTEEEYKNFKSQKSQAVALKKLKIEEKITQYEKIIFEFPNGKLAYNDIMKNLEYHSKIQDKYQCNIDKILRSLPEQIISGIEAVLSLKRPYHHQNFKRILDKMKSDLAIEKSIESEKIEKIKARFDNKPNLEKACSDIAKLFNATQVFQGDPQPKILGIIKENNLTVVEDWETIWLYLKYSIKNEAAEQKIISIFKGQYSHTHKPSLANRPNLTLEGSFYADPGDPDLTQLTDEERILEIKVCDLKGLSTLTLH